MSLSDEEKFVREFDDADAEAAFIESQRNKGGSSCNM